MNTPFGKNIFQILQILKILQDSFNENTIILFANRIRFQLFSLIEYLLPLTN